MSTSVNIRNARSQEIATCAAIHNEWIEETEWMPRLHSAKDMAEHYRNTIFRDQRLLVAETAGEIAGMMSVTRDDVVTGLYVGSRFRRRGIGTHFIERAKRELGGVLSLWTFQANDQARSFYLHRDFVEINRTDGDNEEGLADVLLEWRRN